jgi:hypothetical protein
MTRPRTIRLVALAVFVYFLFFIVRMEFSLSHVDKFRHAKDDHIRNAAERHHRGPKKGLSVAVKHPLSDASGTADSVESEHIKLAPKEEIMSSRRNDVEVHRTPIHGKHDDSNGKKHSRNAIRDGKHETLPKTTLQPTTHVPTVHLEHVKDNHHTTRQHHALTTAVDASHHRHHHQPAHNIHEGKNFAEPETAAISKDHDPENHHRAAHPQEIIEKARMDTVAVHHRNHADKKPSERHAEKNSRNAIIAKKHRAVHRHRKPLNESELVSVEGTVGYAVVISNEEYVDGALVLGVSFHNHSLLLQAERAGLIAIVPENAVSDESIERLQIAGWNHIIRVPDLTKEAPKSHYAGTFNKLYMFNLTQFSRVATFDVDMLMLKNPDSVFKTHLPNESYIGALGNSHNKKHPYFQSGMMLIVPSTRTFESMMKDFRTDPVHKTINGRDGKIIRTFFQDRYINLNDDLSAHLGVHEPLDSVIGFHFRGEWKPWFNKEEPPTKVEYGNKDGKLIEQELGEAFRLWWMIYDHLHVSGFEDLPKTTDAPVGYDPKRQVWLMRHTSQSYTQLLAAVDIAERNLTYPRLTIEKTLKAGDTCDDVCSSRQAICKDDALSFTEVNSCARLTEYFGCKKCTMDYPGQDEPSFDHGDRICYVNPLVYKRLRPNCSALAPGRQRLCPCLPLEEAYHLPVPFEALGLSPLHPPDPLFKNDSHIDLPIDSDEKHEVSGCFPSRGASRFLNDAKCVAYLSEVKNIAFFTSMGRTLRIGRTAKLMAHYKEAGVRAVVKLPQRKFPHEAQSEYVAYLVDRALGILRVPPTAFAFVPHVLLRRGFENVTAADQKESMEFVEDEVWRHVTASNSKYNKVVDSEPALGVSLQLWMNDVHPMVHTNLTLPPKFHEMLVFEHRSGKKAAVPGLPVQPKFARPISELMKMTIFDFIIGNDDRRPPDKNSFVAGGCKRYCRGSSVFRFLDEPQLILIDQGRSIHFPGDPEGNLLSAGTKDSDYLCRNFPTEVVQRALDLSHNITSVGPLTRRKQSSSSTSDSRDETTFTDTLERYLLATSDKKIVEVLQEDRINMVQNRLERFLMHVRRCVSQHHDGTVEKNATAPHNGTAQKHQQNLTVFV